MIIKRSIKARCWKSFPVHFWRGKWQTEIISNDWRKRFFKVPLIGQTFLWCIEPTTTWSRKLKLLAQWRSSIPVLYIFKLHKTNTRT
jgi:hypothetical protein